MSSTAHRHAASRPAMRSSHDRRGRRGTTAQGGRWWKIGLLVVVALIGIDFAAGPVGRSLINRKLAAMDSYSGHVEKVKISLWRARAELQDGRFFQRGFESDPPLVRWKSAAFNVSYLALLRGKISAHIAVDGAEATVVQHTPPADKKTKAEEKKEKDNKSPEPPPSQKIQSWQSIVQNSFPLEISRLELTNARFHYIDRLREPNVDVGIDHFHLLGSGLRNRAEGPGPDGPLPARVEAEGVTTGDGRLKLHVNVDPFAAQPRFTAQIELKSVALPALNPFLLAYANADVARGTFEFDSEITAAAGGYQGYVKPFFKDLDFKTASDKDKNAVQLLTKKAIGAAASLLKNDEEKKVATKAPFSGNFDNNNVDLWTTIVNLLRNAFVQGLREGFEGQTPTPTPVRS